MKNVHHHSHSCVLATTAYPVTGSFHTHRVTWQTMRASSTLGNQLQAHLFFMTSTTPRNMITNSKMPAITPAILTVWSVCFSGSGTGLGVTAPGDEKENTCIRQNKDVTFKCLPLHSTEYDLSEPADRWALAFFFFFFF